MRQTSGPSKPKPRLTSTHSETALTVFANGHHKPCHRLNNAAHTSGMPYKIPRAHTLHGPAPSQHREEDLMHRLYGHQGPRRSIDNLSQTSNELYGGFSTAQASTDSLPLTPLAGIQEANGLPFDANAFLTSLQSDPSMVTSGTGSPDEGQLGDTSIGQYWPWSNTMTSPSNQLDGNSLATSPTGGFFPSSDTDWALPSAGVDPVVPLWSAGDLPLDPEKLTGNMEQPLSHSEESHGHSVPGLTPSSSKAQSETGESAYIGEMDAKMAMPPPIQPHVPESNVQVSRPPASYRYSSASLSGSQAPAAPTSAPIDFRRSLDLEFLRRSNAIMSHQDQDSSSMFNFDLDASSQPLGFGQRRGSRDDSVLYGSSKGFQMPSFTAMNSEPNLASSFSGDFGSMSMMTEPSTIDTSMPSTLPDIAADANNWLVDPSQTSGINYDQIAAGADNIPWL